MSLRPAAQSVIGRQVVAPWQLRSCMGFWLPEPEYTVRDASFRASFVNSLVPKSRRIALEQSVDIERPAWSSSNAAFNGRPTLDFDGTDDFMQADALASSFAGADAPLTSILAANFADMTSDVLFSLGVPTGNVPLMLLFRDGVQRVGVQRGDDAGTVIDRRGATVLGDPAVWEFIFDGARVTVLRNGASVGLDAITFDVGVCSFSQFTLAALRRSTVSNLLNGSIAAWAIYDRALSASERRIARTWLRRRFGI